MLIADDKTIAQIQTEFSSKFPGLKIEFYKSLHDKYKGSSDEDKFPPETIIRNARKIHETKELTIRPEDTVAYIEMTMRDSLGLNVQIYRRSKELWLQTSATDDWTLEKQNSKGLHSLRTDLNLYDKP